MTILNPRGICLMMALAMTAVASADPTAEGAAVLHVADPGKAAMAPAATYRTPTSSGVSVSITRAAMER